MASQGVISRTSLSLKLTSDLMEPINLYLSSPDLYSVRMSIKKFLSNENSSLCNPSCSLESSHEVSL